jgi:hypothetical protein
MNVEECRAPGDRIPTVVFDASQAFLARSSATHAMRTAKKVDVFLAVDATRFSYFGLRGLDFYRQRFAPISARSSREASRAGLTIICAFGGEHVHSCPVSQSK